MVIRPAFAYGGAWRAMLTTERAMLSFTDQQRFSGKEIYEETGNISTLSRHNTMYHAMCADLIGTVDENVAA